MSNRVVIVDGLRTPFIKSGTRFNEVPAWELGRSVSRELLARLALDPADLDEVIFGCVANPADTANIARVIALRAGVPKEVPAVTVSRNCASGMEALTVGAERIACGRADAVLVGGVESMTRIPLLYPHSFSMKIGSLMKARNLGEKVVAGMSFRPRDWRPVIALEKGLTDPTCGEIMGLTGERLARDYGIQREDQDAYALESHQKAVQARDKLAEEISPLAIAPGFHEIVEADNGPRDNQSLEALQKLRPFFDRRLGTVTVGNSCPVTDGAVALVLMSEERAKALGYQPLGVLRGHAYRGCQPERMGLGPVHAARPALREAGVSVADLSRIEINEAFAAQVIACCQAFESERFADDMGWDAPLGVVNPDLLNVNGGAIALGHPVGATGARLVLTLLKELRRSGGGLGLASLCIGGGQGGAVVVEGMPA